MEQKEAKSNLQDRVVSIKRVAKVVKGGRRFSFSALVVVGDGENQVGFGVGKAGEVPDAVKKASDQAKKSMAPVMHINGTLPFEVEGRFGSSVVRMYPAKEGKGVIAGGAARIVLESSGLKDVVCKIHGSKSGHNVVRATLDGLHQLMSVDECAESRGIDKSRILSKQAKKPKKKEASKEGNEEGQK